MERLAERLGVSKFKQRFAGHYAEVSGPSGPLGLLIPTTYMNLSGEAVGPAAGSLRATRSQVLVVHDEIDLPFGTVRGKVGGGAGGHNGLKSVTRGLGGQEYPRIRIGVGRPPAIFHGDEADWVLSNFSEHPDEVERLLASALEMTELAIAEGIDAAVARFHAGEPGARARRRADAEGDGSDDADASAGEPV